MNFDTTLPIVGLAAAIGVRHAFEADHIAAIATITARAATWRRAALLGVAWGAGHTVALLVATAVLILSKTILPERAVLLLEAAVGAVIVVLASRLLIDLYRGRVHMHRHVHGAVTHTHPHQHVAPEGDEPQSHHSAAVMTRPFAVGLLHGAAGSAALLVTTVAATGDATEAVAGVVAFGAASMVAMVVASTALSLPLVWTARHAGAAMRLVTATVGAVSVAFGAWYCYSAVSGM